MAAFILSFHCRFAVMLQERQLPSQSPWAEGKSCFPSAAVGGVRRERLWSFLSLGRGFWSLWWGCPCEVKPSSCLTFLYLWLLSYKMCMPEPPPVCQVRPNLGPSLLWMSPLRAECSLRGLQCQSWRGPLGIAITPNSNFIFHTSSVNNVEQASLIPICL